MKIAGVQMDVTLGDVAKNLQAMNDRLKESRRHGAMLTIFPECALTGYCFDSLEEGLEYAQSVPGPATQIVQEWCQRLGGYVILGLIEGVGRQVYNAAVLVGAEGVLGSYRKVHLPYLGIDRFASYGDRPFAVQSAGDLRVGMSICYDAAFPESSRCLTLTGADINVLPTNWPPGAETMAQYCVNARAMENAIYFAAVNRVGKERGFEFIGLSRICDPTGTTLAASDNRDEIILYAEIDPAKARMKRVVRRPSLHVIDRLADRRPEIYAPLLEPHSLPRPGRDDDAT